MILQNLYETPIIAVLRDIPDGDLLPLVKAMANGGIRYVEITMNTKNAARQIDALKQSGINAVIGAGTAISKTVCEEAINAGASFIVAPNVDEAVINFAHSRDIPVIPGAMTPTEIMRAVNMGCEFVKVFPAGCLKADYFKQVTAALSDVPLIAFGGITADNAQAFLSSGAKGFGVGGCVCNHFTGGKRDLDAVTRYAKTLVELF